MRNYLIILLAFFVCTNINAQVKKTVSKQQKAELLIERFMKENLNDFKSYEPIGYSKIDTLKSEFPCTELGIVTLSLANLALSYHEESSNEINFSSYSTQRERLIPIAKEILGEYKKFTVSYPKIGLGWTITHKCRSKNNRGNLMLGNWIFGFDKEIENIIYIKSDFPEGDKHISTDFLLKQLELIDPTHNIQNMIRDYTKKLAQIKNALYL